ncbi:DUF4190 domain-containing protein [Cellulosimicrobium cellulans]|uniref:DUF4190 domain-containing protein n=1 Tax=Cellulosimicrobium cellulans TaxID=1710 RepID=UPI001962A38B|nr:DUF4190 domain-containing protein [Cellulosimicrobium cellulans]MBN0039196.1 DUF4190 domain-containing protein [Cellulosimicrobium cellulans]
MTTPPVPPYGSPDEPVDPYAAPRPHQPPLTPYNPPTDATADAPAPEQGGFVAPSGAGGGYPGTPAPGAPYGAPAAPVGHGSPYGPGAAPAYGSASGGGYPPSAPSASSGAPGYGAYPPPYGSAYTPPPRTNGLALASMIVSIASLVVCAGFPGIVGLVLGIVALNQVMRDGTRGRGFAVTGIVVGAVCTAFAMLIVLAATFSES